MAKRIIFFAGILISVVIIIVLSILKFTDVKDTSPSTLPQQATAQEVDVPIEEDDNNQDSYEEAEIKLNSDETYINSISADLNEDGLSDEIIAVKKSLNPSIYLILAIQEEENIYKKVTEIKTNVLVPTSIFSTLYNCKILFLQ